MSVIKDDDLVQDVPDITEEVLSEDETQEVEEIERGLNVTTEELVDMVGGFFAYFKCKTMEEQQWYLETYRMRTIPILKLIGFDRALLETPVKKLPPEMTLALGFAIMAGMALFIKVPRAQQSEQPVKFEESFRQPQGGESIDDISLRKNRNGEIILSEEVDQENKG